MNDTIRCHDVRFFGFQFIHQKCVVHLPKQGNVSMSNFMKKTSIKMTEWWPNAIARSLQRTHPFQVDFAPLRGLQNVGDPGLKALSDENTWRQVVEDDVLKSIFVSYWRKCMYLVASHLFCLRHLDTMRTEEESISWSLTVLSTLSFLLMSLPSQVATNGMGNYMITSTTSARILSNLTGRKRNYF